MFRSLLLLALAPLCLAQPVPLPNTPDGFRIGTGGVVVETYMDLLCPDCAGDWPVMGQLLAHYGKKISLILHTFPLPYHTFAFRAAQGAHVVASLNTTSPAEAVFEFAGLMFKSQGDFYGADLNTTWVDNHIAELAATLGYDVSAVKAGLADGNLNEATRISWKYSTSRYSTGTPHYSTYRLLFFSSQERGRGGE
jgi:hypothetical protein